MIAAIRYKVDDATDLCLYAAGGYDGVCWERPQRAKELIGEDDARMLAEQERYTFYPCQPEGKGNSVLYLDADVDEAERVLCLLETQRYQVDIEQHGDEQVPAKQFRFSNEGNKFLKVERNQNSLTFQFINYLGRSRILCKKERTQVLPFLVIPRKISYKEDYLPLTESIAEACTQLLLDMPGVTTSRFSQREDGAATGNRFEQFIFLRKFCYSGNLRSLFEAIRRNPDRQLVSEEEIRPFGMGRPSRKFFTQPFSYGRDWMCMGDGSCLPGRMAAQRKQDSLDTPANRFLKFAFLRFRSLCEGLQEDLAKSQTGAAECGEEAKAIQAVLDELLQDAFFDDVGDMDILPQNNQVLEKREGYAQIFAASSMLDLALQLDWKGEHDVYEGEAKNVALLYEYWVFFELYKVIASMGVPVETKAHPFLREDDGLVISLKQSEESCQSFHLPADHVRVDLYYNRIFDTKWFDEERFDPEAYAGSYSRQFRPDVTIAVYPDTVDGEREAICKGVISYVHFDAKYRLDAFSNLFGKDVEGQAELEAEKAEEVTHHYRRGDLLKMHTYRDAIRRTVGSYVIYPGDTGDKFRLYDEILPGVGAFALKPSAAEDGENVLRAFLEDIIGYRMKHLPRLNLMMHAEESIIRESRNALPYLVKERRSAVPASHEKKCILGYLPMAYKERLEEQGRLEEKAEFPFYFHAISKARRSKNSDAEEREIVHAIPQGLFQAEYFCFHTKTPNVGRTFHLEPFVCAIVLKSCRLVSSSRLVEFLREQGLETERKHHADFYYLIMVRVEHKGVPVKECDRREVDEKNDNRLTGTYGPKVVPLDMVLS